jgi:hypothetical protein
MSFGCIENNLSANIGGLLYLDYNVVDTANRKRKYWLEGASLRGGGRVYPFLQRSFAIREQS